MKKTITSIRTIGISILLGIIFSHWLSLVELPLLMKIRNLAYFKKIDHVENKDNKAFYVYYKHQKESVYNPVGHAQLALKDARRILHNQVSDIYYSEKDITERIDTSKLLTVSNSILNFTDTLNKGGIQCYRLSYEMDYPVYNLEKGWVSGMAQGHAIQLMLGAYLITKDSIYIQHAEKYANLLLIPIDSGGVMEGVNGGYWYEEYAQSNSQARPRVLNGHIFALDGLFFLSLMSDKNTYQELLDLGIRSLEENINRYNFGLLWSRYDWSQIIANNSYHQLHIEQLTRISNISKGSTNILRNRRLFIMGKYIPIGIFYRVVISHNRMLIVTIVFNSFIAYIILCLVRKIRIYNRRKNN